jgi:S-adenosylmethionine:tRNA ribosyltransferase-isomerase
VADGCGVLHESPRERLIGWLRPGDVLVANDAATMPASLTGVHERTGAPIEVRLAGRRTLAMDRVNEFTAVVFGAGDHRTRTEDRPPPPALRAGDRLRLGPLRATVFQQLGHPRLVVLYFLGTPGEIWSGISSHGRPIQYAHIPQPLALWDVWTTVAARSVAFEAPSAGFVLDWRLLGSLRARGIGFATLTHAAGISSTGDAALDARLPLDEAYDLPARTIAAIDRARTAGGRVIALGTTVTRALEHAALRDGRLRAGENVATQRIGPHTELRIVDGIISGAHEPGESHYDVLGAFASEDVLHHVSVALETGGFRSHEFGDSVMIMRRNVETLARPA